MTDKELLEYAARAAGYTTIQHQNPKDSSLDIRYGIDEAIWNGEDYWNPLADDGDALRLAVKMGMEVYIDTHPEGCDCTEVWSVTYDQSKKHERCVGHFGNPHAATRRAIVLCAAGIGEEMYK